MSSHIMNEDLRSIKTKKALYTALFSLLKSFSFKKITIKEICEEALISRATFYAHFIDKYDLLKHWITEIWPEDFNSGDSYEQMEKAVNHYLYENKLILKNLFYDADDETVGILFDFILSTANLSIDKIGSKDLYSKNVVLSNFFAGGMISYLSWQINNKFPPDVPPMNSYLYKIICEFDGMESK